VRAAHADVRGRRGRDAAFIRRALKNERRSHRSVRPVVPRRSSPGARRRSVRRRATTPSAERGRAGPSDGPPPRCSRTAGGGGA
jgi:hypothetical protein